MHVLAGFIAQQKCLKTTSKSVIHKRVFILHIFFPALEGCVGTWICPYCQVISTKVPPWTDLQSITRPQTEKKNIIFFHANAYRQFRISISSHIPVHLFTSIWIKKKRKKKKVKFCYCPELARFQHQHKLKPWWIWITLPQLVINVAIVTLSVFLDITCHCQRTWRQNSVWLLQNLSSTHQTVAHTFIDPSFAYHCDKWKEKVVGPLYRKDAQNVHTYLESNQNNTIGVTKTNKWIFI